MDGGGNHHVLILPLPAQGHVNSMLKLSELLCLAGIHVTFFVSDHDHSLLLLHSNVHRRLSILSGTFRFQIYSDGLPPENPRSGIQFASHIFSSFRFTINSFFLEYLNNSDTQPPPTCIICDGAMCSSLLDLGEQRGLPVIYFRTIGASCFWCYYRFPQLIDSNEIPFQGTDDLDLPIQNVTAMEGFLRRRDLPNMCRTSDVNELGIQSIMTESLSTRRAHGLILNTFEDLEGPVLDEIRTQIPNVYTIGPIHAHLKTRLSEKKKNTSSSSNSLWKEDRSCMAWLDSQPEKSVIYMSFGSLAIMTKEQLVEFWYGLVNSGKRFLWVVRPDSVTDNSGEIPDELEDGTKERGLIVDWVPQVEVLSHPAVAVFLTHSGWNSTLESIEAGVPMICWPFFLDQYLNSRLVGRWWVLGMDMKDSCDRVVVKRMIDEVMDVRRDEFVNRAKEMAELTRKAITSGGSSYSNFDRLIEDIRSMATGTNQQNGKM